MVAAAAKQDGDTFCKRFLCGEWENVVSSVDYRGIDFGVKSEFVAHQLNGLRTEAFGEKADDH